MDPRRKTGLSLLFLAGFGGLLTRPATAQKTDIALGDSLAYGFMDFTSTPVGKSGAPNYYPGYVTPYANFLSSQTGTTYSVVNLGVTGETAGRLGATSIADGTPDSALNTNYGPGDTQASLLDSAIAAAGPTLGVITIQVGANDLLDALAAGQDPGAAITSVDTNYGALLTQIQHDQGGGPLTDVTILGYYNPYAALPDVPAYASLKAAALYYTPLLNAALQSQAQTYGARFVDLYDPFLGHENDDTLVNVNTIDGFPNDHPNAQGYALIAQQLEAPEPPAFAGFGMGALGLGVLAWRVRRRHA